jgi:hypothetical protein
MDVATICVGVWASAQSILAAKFGSLCDSQGTWCGVSSKAVMSHTDLYVMA